MTVDSISVHWVFDDGGRAAAGYKGFADDCACRAISIAVGLPYSQVYGMLTEAGQAERTSKRRRTRSHPRTGMHTATMKQVMAALGWRWIPAMGIGTGCQVHLRADELPAGRIIARVSKHYVAVVNGVLLDTHDPSREGTRCVYGWFEK